MSQARIWIFVTPAYLNDANAALEAHDPNWAGSIVAQLPEQTDIDAPPPTPLLHYAGWQDDEQVLATVRQLLANVPETRIFAGATWGIEEETDVSDDDTQDPGLYDKVTQRAAKVIAARQLGVDLSPPAQTNP